METLGVVVIVLYASLYASLHSLLASDTAKTFARGVFGKGVERWYRLTYNVLAYVALIPSDILVSQFPDREIYALSGPWYSLAVTGRIVSVGGLLYGIYLLGFWDFFGLRQIMRAQRSDETLPSRLRTTGIYGWVRHPKYLFVLGILWLAPRMTINLFALYLIFSLYLYVGTFFEERRLVREFGAEYAEYRRRVPRIIPIRGLHWVRGSGEATAG